MKTEEVAPNVTSPRSRLRGSAMFLAGALVAALLVGSVAFAAHDATTIHACAQNTTGDLRVVADADQCRPQERAIQWNAQGPAGPAEIPDGAIKTRHLAPDVAGVAAAGFSFSWDGELQGSYNRFGGAPTVEVISDGEGRQGSSFRQFRVTVPGLEDAVADGDVLLTQSVQAAEPVLVTHQLRPDGSFDVFVWVGDDLEGPGTTVEVTYHNGGAA